MRTKIIFAAAVAAAIALSVGGASARDRDQSASWREVATETDRNRIRGWRSTWMEGLRQARERHLAEISGEGDLLNPDAALLDPAPPPGAYRCRTIKIGAQSDAMLDWVAYPDFACRIAARDGLLTFTRQGGSQRPIGRIYPDNVRRMIFLGTLQLGDERQVLPYGSDADRDMAGILERVGERRWRLVFPRPTFESIIDVVELVPAG